MSEEKVLSKKDQLKKLNADRKKILEQERALKEELDKGKEARKTAKNRVIRAKKEGAESREKLTKAIRLINGVMLSKSIKNNLDEFKEAMEELHGAATKFLQDGNEIIEAYEELKSNE